jgi:hypothetical protein
MKKIILLFTLVSAIIFSSCKKDDPAAANGNTITLRYDFTADVAGEYDFAYSVDTAINYETLNTQSWSRTVIVTRPATSQVDSASLTVFPPAAWIGTTIQANAIVKIFVNGVEKAQNAAVIGGFDRPTGLTAKTTF